MFRKAMTAAALALALSLVPAARPALAAEAAPSGLTIDVLTELSSSWAALVSWWAGATGGESGAPGAAAESDNGGCIDPNGSTAPCVQQSSESDGEQGACIDPDG